MWIIVLLVLSIVNAQVDPQLPDAPRYPSEGIRLAQCCNIVLLRVQQLDYFPSHSTLLGLYNLQRIQPWDISVDFSFDSAKLREIVIEFVRSSDCRDTELLIWNWKTSSFIKAEKAPTEYHLWNENHGDFFHKLRFVRKGSDPLLAPFVNLYSIAKQSHSSELRWTVVPYEKSQQTRYASNLPSSLFFPTTSCELAEFGGIRCPPNIELYLKTMFGDDWRTPLQTWNEEAGKFVQMVTLNTTTKESKSILTNDFAILLGCCAATAMAFIYRRRGTVKKE